MVTHWGFSIALEMFFGGLSVGTFIIAVVLNYLNSQKGKKVARISAYLSPFCMLISLLALTIHLGRPFGAFWIILQFNFTSVLAYGALFQGIFFIISIIYALAVCSTSEDAKIYEEGEAKGVIKIMRYLLAKVKADKIRDKFARIGLPIAIIVGIYHGFILMSFKSKAMWNTGILPILTIGSLLTTGIALTLFIIFYKVNSETGSDGTKLLRNILVISLGLQTAFVIIYIFSMLLGGSEGKEAMLKLVFSFFYGLPFWILAFIGGLLVPTLLGFKDMVKSKENGTFVFTAPILMTVSILVGGFFFRYMIILAAQ